MARAMASSLSTLEQAVSLVAEGRVARVGNGYAVRGRSRIYRVTVKPDGSLRCECPVPKQTPCSHRLAVRQYQIELQQQQAKEC